MPKWLQTLLKWEPGISLGQWAYDRVVANWKTIVSLGGGAVMGFLATITDWIEAMGPAGVGAVVIATFLVMWIGLTIAQAFRAKARRHDIEGRAIARWDVRTDAINPLDNEFHRKRIFISDLIHPVTKRIEDKRFIDCELVGPANLIMIDVDPVIGSQFINCDTVVLKPADRLLVLNGVQMPNVSLINTKILNCTLYISRDMVPLFRGMGAGFVTLTGDQEIDALAPPEIEAERQQ